MQIRWSTNAVHELEQIGEYIRRDSAVKALQICRRIYRGIARLEKFPYRGRIGTTEGTRELVFAPLPYIAVYQIKSDVVEVLHIYHAARDWQE